MSDSADAICNSVNHAEEVERREASPLTASKAGKGGTLPFFMGQSSASLAGKRVPLGAGDGTPFCNPPFGG